MDMNESHPDFHDDAIHMLTVQNVLCMTTKWSPMASRVKT